MKVIVPFFLCIFLIFSCKIQNENTDFGLIHKEYLENRKNLLPELRFEEKNFPVQAPNKNRLQKAADYFQQMSFDLGEFDQDQLNERNKNLLATLKYDVQMCTNFLKDGAYEWDPSFYNVGGILKSKLNNPNTPNLCDRLDYILNDFENIPAYYETAKSNFIKPSIKKTLLAIDKNSLGFHFLKNELMDSLAIAECMQFDKEEFIKEMDRSLIAIKDYVAFCNSLKFEYGELKSDVVFRDSL